LNVALLEDDTIAAIATPTGSGGIGIVRVSGRNALLFAECIAQKKLAPRTAHFVRFVAHNQQLIDHGLALYFPAPHSFTGEDVVEFHAHGSTVVLDNLLRELFHFGARPARAGEFSERAFLNNKIDLTQAEAIADLIAASSQHAAQSALNSLQGNFSASINVLIDKLVALRAYIEAALDFPEEEVDFLSSGKIAEQLRALQAQIETVLDHAKQGALVTEGMTVVIAGKPNAGKSSLLNALAQRDAAIVTPIAGTTRDVLREHIQIDGMPLHVIDTAGLRETQDLIEQEGVRRARAEMAKADRILLVLDMNDTDNNEAERLALQTLLPNIPVTWVNNKCDLAGVAPQTDEASVTLSAKTGAGLDLLREHLKHGMGYREEAASKTSARRRHVLALQKTLQHIVQGRALLQGKTGSELLAEELRLAQLDLEEITGRFAPDDLLEKIFRDFCIGK
jgi:tRNA modification GTPase